MRIKQLKSDSMLMMLALAGLMQGMSIAFAMIPVVVFVVGGLRGIGRIWLIKPVFLLSAYFAYLLVNLAISGALGDLASVDFWRYDGKQIYTLSLFILGVAFFTARPRYTLDDFCRALITVALVVLPLMLLFGERKIGIVNGFYKSHNALAGMVGAIFIVCVHLIISRRSSSVLPSWALWTTAVLCVALFTMAQSRAFLFGMAVSMTYVLVVNARGLMARKYLVFGVAALLFVAVASSPFSERLKLNYIRDDTNLATRLEVWTEAADFIARSPIVGIGFGSINDDYILTRKYAPFLELRTRSSTFHGEHHAHNILLQLWAELGAVAVLLYASIWFAIFRRETIPGSPQEQETTRTREMLLTLFIYVAGASVLGNNLLTPASAAVLYLIAALYVSRTRPMTKAGKRVKSQAMPPLRMSHA